MATAAVLTVEAIDWTMVDTHRSRVIRGYDAEGRFTVGSTAVAGDLLVVMVDGTEHLVSFTRAD